jgi:hypothetical protein
MIPPDMRESSVVEVQMRDVGCGDDGMVVAGGRDGGEFYWRPLFSGTGLIKSHL